MNFIKIGLVLDLFFSALGHIFQIVYEFRAPIGVALTIFSRALDV
jgi:hypothetical protein